MSTDRTKPATARDVRSFGAIVFVASAVASVVLYRRGAAPRVLLAIIGAGTLVAVVAALVPDALRPVYRVWMAIGHALGRVTTPIVLAVLFFGVMVPLRVLLRVFGRDPLEIRFDRGARTYWSDRRRTKFERDDFERLA